jgi:hypothetical protein
MRIVEEQHPSESAWLWKLGNLTAIDSDMVKSIGFAWLFKEGGRWVFRPRVTGNVALFYNAVFFLRLCWPFGVFWMVRWAASGDKQFAQGGGGYKLNGRLTITLRIQNDASAAAGVTGPNVGQATGFNYGTH